MKALIVTADDFGNSIPINEAVESGHRDGVLTAASLMVAGPAFDDAVDRARRLPRLGVGLHLTLVDAKPVLPAHEIPDLVGPDGRFNSDATRQGIALFFSPARRRQARAEIRAQFEKFQSTGLPLDHVNGHQHFHMHPVVVSELVQLLPKFGSPPVRLPLEPFAPSYAAIMEGKMRRYASAVFYASQTWWLRRKMKSIGIIQNDAVFGINDTGNMDADRIVRYLKCLPHGTSELYLHPATRRWSGPENLPAHYRMEAEFAALIDPRVRTTLNELKITPTTFQSAFPASAAA